MGTIGNKHSLSSIFVVWLDYRIENLRYLSKQNPNFGDARRITTENAPTDFCSYLFWTKSVETTDTAALWKIAGTLYQDVLFKALK